MGPRNYEWTEYSMTLQTTLNSFILSTVYTRLKSLGTCVILCLVSVDLVQNERECERRALFLTKTEQVNCQLAVRQGATILCLFCDEEYQWNHALYIRFERSVNLLTRVAIIL